MNAMRERTKFQVCANHTFLKTLKRQRRAEFFCEGGPASRRPCDPAKPCRIWPGTDLFVPEICTSEADWPRAVWACNREAHA